MTKIKGTFAKTYDRFIKRTTLLPGGLLELVKSTGAKTVLDFACGTGNIAVGLSLEGFDVTGVDHSPDMLDRARPKAREYKTKTKFIPGDITKIDFKREFDLILCLGNTLPFIKTDRELRGLFANCRKHLRQDGHVVFQQLNYDRILRERPATFAIDVDGDIIRFKQYRYLENMVEFVVTIVYGQEIPPKVTVSKARLRPWLKADLLIALKNAGFSKIRALGNYSGEKYIGFSKDLILIGKS